MLPATHRLRKTREIERVWKSGRSFFTPLLLVKIVPNGLAVSRFAVVVGTKAEKRAVKRNLWKRRVREIVRAYLPGLQPGFDVVIFAKKQGVLVDFDELRSSLTRALELARLLRPRP